MPYANVVIPVWGSSIEGDLPQALETDGVRLQWSKGESCHVQIVTSRFVPGSAGWMPEAEGEHGLDTAHWAILDRRTINELIRHLRQARDDAFGKDA